DLANLNPLSRREADLLRQDHTGNAGSHLLQLRTKGQRMNGFMLAVMFSGGVIKNQTTLALPYRAGHENIRLDGQDVKGTHEGNRLEIPLRAGDHQANY